MGVTIRNFQQPTETNSAYVRRAIKRWIWPLYALSLIVGLTTTIQLTVFGMIVVLDSFLLSPTATPLYCNIIINGFIVPEPGVLFLFHCTTAPQCHKKKLIIRYHLNSALRKC